MSRYDDILDLPRPVSKKHPPMSMEERAAQFSPFAALTGFGAVITERARLTEARIELDESARAELDERLRALADRGEGSPVRLTCFLPDEKKEGGSYLTVTGRVKRVDPLQQLLLLTDGREIPLEDLYALEET